MKRKIRLPLILAVIAQLAPASGFAEIPDGAHARLCGSQFLKGQRLEGGGALPRIDARKPQAVAQIEEITVGTTLHFPVAGAPSLLRATCQYVGDYSFVFVADREWDTNGGPVLQSDVNRLGELFDRATPADPARGIYDLSTAVFGDAPDVDGYQQVFILVLDIPRSNVFGFFDPAVAEHEIPELRRDVLYLDEFAVRREVKLASGTLAHEFQHLIHWGHDADEEFWINEGLSGYAEEVSGFAEADPVAVPEFLKRPWIGLTQWPLNVRAHHYGSTYLFISFLAERYGAGGFIRSLVAEPRNGRFGVDEAFEGLGIEETFASAWGDWVVANFVSDGQLSYTALDGRRVLAEIVEEIPSEPLERIVPEPWGTNNILVRITGSFMISFDGDDTGRFQVWGHGWRSGVTQAQEFELDDQMRGTLSVSDVDSVALVIGRTSIAGESFQLSVRTITPTVIEGSAPDSPLPQGVRLGHAYPNPFNSQLAIPFSLGSRMQVELDVYGIGGQHIRRLLGGTLGAGSHVVRWDGQDIEGRRVASGTYTIRLGIPESEGALLSRISYLK